MAVLSYTVLTAAAMLVAWLSMRITRMKPGTPGPWCAGCEYSLVGADLTGTCPECGNDHASRPPRYTPRFIRRWCWPALLAWTAAVATLSYVAQATVLPKHEDRWISFTFTYKVKAAGPNPITVINDIFRGQFHLHGWCWGTFDREHPLVGLSSPVWRIEADDPRVRATIDIERLELVDRSSGMPSVVRGDSVAELIQTWWHAADADTAADLAAVLEQIAGGDMSPASASFSVMRRGPPAWHDARTPWWLLLPFGVAMILWWRRGARRLWDLNLREEKPTAG